MLESAIREREKGRKVMLACVETHGCEIVESLASQFEPGGQARGFKQRDALDLDFVLTRHPDLVLVDNLAVSNPVGARHPRRWQDVSEMLESGIDVMTTLDVQSLASRADAAGHILGEPIKETVPDTFIEVAEIELVDAPPARILSRLKSQDPSNNLGGEPAAMLSKLTALREMTMRFVAEASAREVDRYISQGRVSGPSKSGHRLLVGVNAGQASEQIIRWARRMADSLNCPWLAVYVETSGSLAKADQTRVTRNLELARELGSEILTTADEDVVRGLLRVAFQRNVTQIVVGKPPGGPLIDVFRRNLRLRRLVRDSGEIDIHIVRANPQTPSKMLLRWPVLNRPYWADCLRALGVVVLVTMLNYLMAPRVGIHAVALNYLLAVVIIGLFFRRGPTLLAAAMSALVWDYYFLPPVYAFRVTSFEDGMLLTMYFVVAVVLGELTARNRAQQAAERQREERATALYLLTRELGEADGLEQILQKAVQQTGRAFKAHVGILLLDAPHRLNQQFFAPNTVEEHDRENVLCAWVAEHGQAAGKYTDNLSLAEAQYVPLGINGKVIGAMGLRFNQPGPPTLQQRNLLEAFSHQISMAVDRHRLQLDSEKAKLVAESERLSKTLLNSMSHEIRTPLAAIKSALANLIEFQESAWSPAQQTMLGEIQEATDRLNRLVGNVLDATRLESGLVKPKLRLCDVRDLLQVSVRETRKQLSRHQLILELAPDLPLVNMDFVLMQQAMVNLLSNAALHTPPGTSVRLTAGVQDEALLLAVSDNGPGIPAEALGRVFEKFYRAPNARTGGTGLGLSLVKGFVEAQGGTVIVENQAGGGARFTVRLPLHHLSPAQSGA